MTTSFRTRMRRFAAVTAAVFGLAALSPFVALATNVTWTADTDLQVGAHRLVILSGSAADSLSVDSSASTFTVTATNGDVFRVRYPGPNAGTLANDGGLAACNNVSGNNDVTVTAPGAGSVTVTFTPNATACVAGGGGGSTTPTIILSQPNGGQTFAGGSMTQVFWGTGGSGIQGIRLSLSFDSGATFSLISDNQNNDGSYDWSVPMAASTTARIKADALGSGGSVVASDTSDANFTITVPSSGGGGGGGGGGGSTTPPPPPPPPTTSKVLPKITGFTPVSGAVGSEVTITGTDFGTDVMVGFGGVRAVDIILVTSTSIKVTVPSGAVTGKITVTNAAGTATSAGDFTVTPGTAPVVPTIRVKVLSPNGGESYPTSSQVIMRWDISSDEASGPIMTTPYLSADGGATWNPIGDAAVRANSYTFFLTLPETPMARVRVVAVDQVGNTASDDSDEDFKVATQGSAVVETTYPTGTYAPVPLTDEEIKAPDIDPNATGSGYTSGGAIAATPTIDVDKSLIPPPPEVKIPCIGGTLIKIRSNSAVYYCGKNGRRFVFPNENIYFTWFVNFNAVATVSDETMAKIPIGGNITYKPGVKMVKIQTDPKVYAIARDGLLRWVKDEAVAVRLYGSIWNQKIDDVPDSFFLNYTVGDPLE